MHRTFQVLLTVLALGLGSRVRADIPCPDESYATVTFSQVFTGDYRTGEPRDVVTVGPNGGIETLASNGITIHVYLRNCAGLPVIGVPRQEVVLFNSGLCICPGGNIADADTDVNGHTTFTGSLNAGGCVSNISVFADGIFLAMLPVRFNSPDAVPASPCMVDASDLSGLVANRGSTNAPCFDWNEDGIVDSSDIAYFATLRGGACP